MHLEVLSLVELFRAGLKDLLRPELGPASDSIGTMTEDNGRPFRLDLNHGNSFNEIADKRIEARK